MQTTGDRSASVMPGCSPRPRTEPDPTPRSHRVAPVTRRCDNPVVAIRVSPQMRESGRRIAQALGIDGPLRAVYERRIRPLVHQLW